MKLSVILSAVLLTITLFVGLQFQKRISDARERLDNIKETASILQNSTEPGADIDTDEQQKEVRELMDLSKEIARTNTLLDQSTGDDIENRITLRSQLNNALIPLISFSHEKLDLLTKIIVRDPDLDEEMRLAMLKWVLQIIAMEEPEIAANRVLQVAGRLELKPRDSGPLIRSVAHEYILRKPFDASSWLLLNEEKLAPCFEDLKSSLLIRMTEKDPASAMNLLPSLSSSKTRSYDLYAFGLNSTNADAFFKVLRKRSLSEKRMNNFYSGLVRGPFTHDFDSAVEVLDSESLTTDERDRFLSALFFIRLQVSDDDLTKWLSYAITKPKTDGFDPVFQINRQLQSLIERDYRAMGTWITDLPESSHKRDWIDSYIKIVSPHDPAAAAEFAKANQ